jgi:endonuclease/exonuclease/phosphatase family metal-dependent hydrolase
MQIRPARPRRTPPSAGRAIDHLEPRRLCSTTTLRIVSYNIEDDIDGYTAPRAGMATVLEGLGAYTIGTTARPIDVLALEETTSNADSVAPIVADLNSYYGAGTYAASTLQLTESGGDAGDGNGPSALVYDTKTVQLLASVGLSMPTGVYRQVGRYELEAVGSTTPFYMYVDHYKSGTTSADATDRADEAAAVRKDEATLPSTTRVIYAGDFNTNTDGEGIFTKLMATGQGQAFDPLDPNGGVGNVAQGVSTYTESATALKYRDDYQMVTSSVLSDATGLELVSGSEQPFGNNGSVASGGSVASSSNTALAGLSNRSAVLSALTTASDHLPVVADYTVPLATPTPTPTGSIAGTVFKDANDNGKLDPGESGFSGVTVYLDLNDNGVLDSTDPTYKVGSTGTYSFNYLPAGTFYIREVVPSGYTVTTPANDVFTTTITTGQAVTGANFGNAVTPTSTLTGSISGYAYHDANDDGKYDAGDTVLAGVTIYLDLNHDGKFDSGDVSYVTGSNGYYSFNYLPAGTFYVGEVIPAGYSKLTSPTTGEFALTITAGEAVTNVDFGNV